MLDGLGRPVGAQLGISAPNHAPDKAPSVAYGDGEFLVAWEGCNVATGCRIVGQRVGSDGQRIGDTIRIGDSRGYLEVVFNPNQREYFVIWANGEVFGQRLAWDGIELGENDFQSPKAVQLEGCRSTTPMSPTTPAATSIWWPGISRTVSISGNVKSGPSCSTGKARSLGPMTSA